MNMIFQDLTTATTYIRTNYRNQSSYKLASIFGYLRKRNCYSFFGDYPIISVIISAAKRKKIFISTSEISRVFRKSEELKRYRRVNNVLVKNLAMKEKL